MGKGKCGLWEVVKVSFTGKVRLEQRPEESEEARPAAVVDKAFHRTGECWTFLKKNIKEASGS